MAEDLVLVAVAGAVAGGAELAALAGGAPLERVAVATSSGSLRAGDASRAAYGAAFSSGPPRHHTVELLAALAAALVPGGRLVAREPGAGPDDLAALRKALLLSGFADADALPSGDGLAAATPRWAAGARAAIALRKPAAAAAAAPAAAAAAWRLDADEDGEVLVDAEALLTADDLARPDPAAAAGGCPPTKKACANCSCGRAEGEAAEPAKLTRAMLESPGEAGGCGSCALGDAFRCGGCPYRGLPAFEAGKRIEVPADFLGADL
jgi:hypothetical protein